MAQYRKRGQIDLFEKVPAKKKIDWDAWFGGIFFLVIIIAVVANLTS